MSLGFGFSLPALAQYGGGGTNPFGQLGPTLDLSFTGNAGNLSGTDTYTLDTNFITPQYQIAAQYAVWTATGLTQVNFADVVTFTRGSNATQFDSTGSLVYAPVNLLTWSEDFGNAAWTKQASVSIATNTTVAPNGTTTGDTVTADSGFGVFQQLAVTVGTQVTQSVYLRAGTATSIMFRDDTGAGRHIVVNPSTGAITSTSGTLLNSGSVSVGNGWYRIFFSYTADSTLVRNIIRPDSAGAAQTFIVWGGQTSLFPTLGGVTADFATYYPTTTTAYYGPRFDYNPSTLAAQGLLIEEARTNSIRNNTMQGAVNSTGIASATVASGGTGYTVGNVLTVSGGTGTAATFTVTGASAGVITSVSVTTAGSYTVFPTSPVSVTGGSGSGATFNIVLNGTLPNNWAVSGLGTLTQQVVGTGTVNGITYIDLRFSGTTSTTSVSIRHEPSGTGGVAAVNGQTWSQSAWTAVVAGSTTNITQAGLSANIFDSGGAFLSSISYTNFIANTTSTLTRVTPSGTIATVGTAFIQPQIYLTFSSGVAIDITLRIGLPQLENNNISTGVASATVSAGGSGYAVGDVLQIVGGTGSTAARLTVATLSGSAIATVTVSTAGSYSVFPSPQPVSVTAITGTGTSATFNIVPQTQTGFATSVIPTTTTALTRSADVASVNTLSPWFNATAGTLYAESFRTTIAAASTFPSYAEFDNGTTNRYGVYNNQTASTNEYRSFVQDAGVGQADIGGAASRVAAGTVVKQAAAFAANDFALSVNGSSVFTDTAGTLPSSVNRMSIGSSYIAANFANAWIRRITYYPRRLPNADLQTITT